MLAALDVRAASLLTLNIEPLPWQLASSACRRSARAGGLATDPARLSAALHTPFTPVMGASWVMSAAASAGGVVAGGNGGVVVGAVNVSDPSVVLAATMQRVRASMVSGGWRVEE